MAFKLLASPNFKLVSDEIKDTLFSSRNKVLIPPIRLMPIFFPQSHKKFPVALHNNPFFD